MITLVLGGARSGKSAVAERFALRTGSVVTFVATADVSDDPDLAIRVAAHRARRPAEWTTVECAGDLNAVLTGIVGTALIDSLGTWLAGLPDMAPDCEALCVTLSVREGDTIIVSDEVGLGVHPSSQEGRAFRDALGTLNQAVAAIADSVVLVVAGRLLTLHDSGH